MGYWCSCPEKYISESNVVRKLPWRRVDVDLDGLCLNCGHYTVNQECNPRQWNRVVAEGRRAYKGKWGSNCNWSNQDYGVFTSGAGCELTRIVYDQYGLPDAPTEVFFDSWMKQTYGRLDKNVE